MGFLIIAMVVSHMITRAWEESKRHSAARWQEARRAAHERQSAREKRRQAAAKARNKRINTARKAGPSDPLWWLWAAGWLAAATVKGGAAAVAGARHGAIAGAREGYRIGHERGRARQARQRRDEAAYQRGRREAGDQTRRSDDGEAVTVAPCPHCETLQENPAGCPCRDPQGDPVIHDEPQFGFDAGQRAEHTAADERFFALRNAGYTGPIDQDGYAVDALVAGRPDPHNEQQEEEEVVDAEIVEDPEPVSTDQHTLAIEAGDQDMATINGISGGDGEGYASALTFTDEMSKGLEELTSVVTDFGDVLASKNVDATSSQLVSELYDHLEAAANAAAQLRSHTEAQHGEVAHAIAGAGGSGNVADTDWYDQL